MGYRRIDYLEWARTFMGAVRCDLARSNVVSVTPEELGLGAEHLRTDIVDEQGLPELRELLGRKYGVPAARVHVTNGATSAILLAVTSLLRPGDEVLLEQPNYEPLYRTAVLAGASVKMLERTFERGWHLDLEELERKISRHTRMILLTNCHNPTGAATPPERMMTVGQIARGCQAKVVVSEAYLDNLFHGRPVSCVSHGEPMAAIGSLSKVYGLGGLRIGWIVADEETIRRVRVAADYAAGGVSTPSQVIALHALKQADRLIERCRRIVMGGVAIVRDWLRKRDDVSWSEPEGGTVAVLRLPRGMDAMTVSTRLRERHSTLVVPGDFFWLKGYIRIALGVPEETLRAGLKNLGATLDELASEAR